MKPSKLIAASSGCLYLQFLNPDAEKNPSVWGDYSKVNSYSATKPDLQNLYRLKVATSVVSWLATLSPWL